MALDFIERLNAYQHSISLSCVLTIYPCQIRVRQRWQSKLQLLTVTARKKEWWPATADSLPQAVTCQLWNTLRYTRIQILPHCKICKL